MIRGSITASLPLLLLCEAVLAAQVSTRMVADPVQVVDIRRSVPEVATIKTATSEWAVRDDSIVILFNPENESVVVRLRIDGAVESVLRLPYPVESTVAIDPEGHTVLLQRRLSKSSNAAPFQVRVFSRAGKEIAEKNKRSNVGGQLIVGGADLLVTTRTQIVRFPGASTEGMDATIPPVGDYPSASYVLPDGRMLSVGIMTDRIYVRGKDPDAAYEAAIDFSLMPEIRPKPPSSTNARYSSFLATAVDETGNLYALLSSYNIASGIPLVKINVKTGRVTEGIYLQMPSFEELKVPGNPSGRILPTALSVSKSGEVVVYDRGRAVMSRFSIQTMEHYK